MTPDFKIIAAGVNITPQIADRLLSLSVSDEAGLKSDQVSIELDDRDNAIELPAPGALLAVFMGYKESGLIPMGVFTADEVKAKGPPDTLTITGKAANLGGSIQEQKTRAWDDVTIEQIVAKIAGEHKLTPMVAKKLAQIHFDHLDQTDESDVAFLNRLAKDHDALATVKGQTMLFIERGEGKTASGLKMLPVPITRTGKIRWSMTLITRGKFGSVEATWHNQETGQKEKVTAGEEKPVKKLRHVYGDKAEAQRAAEAKLKEAKRSGTSLSLSMPGNPLIAAEGQVLAIGFRDGVAGLWSIKTAKHEINGSGFRTSITAEPPNSETK